MTGNALTTDQMLLVMELAGLEYDEAGPGYYPRMRLRAATWRYPHICDAHPSSDTVRAMGRDFIIKELFQAFLDGRGRTRDREKDV